jgi:[ribosomal protein S18]-alanine N-acetyltransferase
MNAVVAPTSVSDYAKAPLVARPMRVLDLDWVTRHEQMIYPFPWSRSNFSDSLKAGYDAWVFSIGDTGVNGWASVENPPIGYAVLMWIPDEMHLLNLSVLVQFQQQGWGQQMLRWLCQQGARSQSRRLLLEVRPSNAAALKLYSRFGFEQIGLRKRYYPAPNNTREDALVMSIRLPLSQA